MPSGAMRAGWGIVVCCWFYVVGGDFCFLYLLDKLLFTTYSSSARRVPKTAFNDVGVSMGDGAAFGHTLGRDSCDIIGGCAIRVFGDAGAKAPITRFLCNSHSTAVGLRGNGCAVGTFCNTRRGTSHSRFCIFNRASFAVSTSGGAIGVGYTPAYKHLEAMFTRGVTASFSDCCMRCAARTLATTKAMTS